jgi:hypothetical protein
MAGHDARALGIEALGQLEERAVDVETERIGGDAVADRMLRIDLEVEDGARREMLIARQPFFRFRTGMGIFSIARSQALPIVTSAAVGDELLELLDTGRADASAVLGPDLARVVAVDDPADPGRR